MVILKQFKNSKEAGEEMVKGFLDFYKSSLLGPDWGESVYIFPAGAGYRLTISMMSSELTMDEMREIWTAFSDWLEQSPHDYTYSWAPWLHAGSEYWDLNYNPGLVATPYDPREPERAGFWSGNLYELSAYWMAYVSRFLKYEHILEDTHVRVVLVSLI